MVFLAIGDFYTWGACPAVSAAVSGPAVSVLRFAAVWSAVC
jgi:hypothetical protein